MEKKIVKKETSELSKNHQGITNETEGTGGKNVRHNSKLCPVQSFEKYLSKRHACTDFSCIPKTSFQMAGQYSIGTNPWEFLLFLTH